MGIEGVSIQEGIFGENSSYFRECMMKNSYLVLICTLFIHGCDSTSHEQSNSDIELGDRLPTLQSHSIQSPNTSSISNKQRIDEVGENVLINEEYRDLEGTWRQVSGRAFGADIPKEVIEGQRFTLKGKLKTVFMKDGQILASGISVEIDPHSHPKH